MELNKKEPKAKKEGKEVGEDEEIDTTDVNVNEPRKTRSSKVFATNKRSRSPSPEYNPGSDDDDEEEGGKKKKKN